MFFITLLGLFLRLSNIIKPEGLWNDEYVSWMVASTNFSNGFWNEVVKQCHMPLYYLYLKPFTQFSDSILRLTSLLPSIISIVVMYFVGKEYSKKTGIFAASVTSVLSFLVYYSQEVRFYSLLFLFSTLSLLFTIKLIKRNSKVNLGWYLFFNILILFTHVLGIIYVFFNVLYIIYKKRLLTQKLIICLLIPVVFVLLLGINILNQLPSSQWWGTFSYTNILFLFSDFLSPILSNNVNAPPVFFYNIKLIIWITVPTLIGLIGLIAGIKNNKGFSMIVLGTIVVMSILAITGKIVFVTKYTIEILPIIIILLSCGFVRMKKCGLMLFALFIAFHLSSFFTPNYVTKKIRAEGHRIPCVILAAKKPQKVVFTYYAPNRFTRYRNDNGISYSINKNNRFEYNNDPKRILENIKIGERVSVVFLDSVSFVPEKYINVIKLPEMFVTFSHIKNMLIEELNNSYRDFDVVTKASWTVITATKYK